jgi:hypothetical protein
MPNDWRTAAELATTITAYRRAVHDLTRRNHSHGASDAGEVVAHIYNFAGADDATANARGGEMIRVGAAIQGHLDEIGKLLGTANGILKKAVEFMDDAEAKRKHTAATYRV